MKKLALLSTVTFAAAFSLSAPPAHAVDYFVFKASVTIPVTYVDHSGAVVDAVITKTLVNNDIINLALGRVLGTKVDAKTEVLALAAAFDTSGMPPDSKLIVYDPSASGVAVEKLVVAKLTGLTFDEGYLSASSKGQGNGTVAVQPTTAGNGKNALQASTLYGAGSSSGPHQPVSIPINYATIPFALSGTAAFTGEFKFAADDKQGMPHTYDGTVIKGKMTASGKRLGVYTK